MFKYNRPNRRLECCRWTYLRSQMSYPHARCVLLCFLSELHTWGKEVRDWRWLCFYFYSSPSSCGLSAYKPLCVHEGFLQLIPPPSVARTPPLAWSKDHVHHLEWKLTAMSPGSEQRQARTLSCMTGQQPSTAINQEEPPIFLDRFKFPGAAVIRCFALCPCSQDVTYSLPLAHFSFLLCHPGAARSPSTDI